MLMALVLHALHIPGHNVKQENAQQINAWLERKYNKMGDVHLSHAQLIPDCRLMDLAALISVRAAKSSK